MQVAAAKNVFSRFGLQIDARSLTQDSLFSAIQFLYRIQLVPVVKAWKSLDQ